MGIFKKTGFFEAFLCSLYVDLCSFLLKSGNHCGYVDGICSHVFRDCFEQLGFGSYQYVRIAIEQQLAMICIMLWEKKTTLTIH